VFVSNLDFSGRTKVYVIEDDPDHQKIAEFALRAAGVESIVFFGNGEEAMEYFQKEEPESTTSSPVIFIDLMLPNIGGLEILANLKSDDRWRSSVMVVLTCSTSNDDRVMSEKLGADGYLIKPLQAESVRKILTSLT
jgi:CheY-like chemotaxis protein